MHRRQRSRFHKFFSEIKIKNVSSLSFIAIIIIHKFLVIKKAIKEIDEIIANYELSSEESTLY